MAIIKPFCGLRPTIQLAARVATLPYDVMNTAEARIMAAGNPFSFLHVSRAEIDLPEGTDVHAHEVYDQAASNFKALIANGTLVADTTPHLYIYAQTMAGRRQIGLVACSSIADYYSDIIKKHEYTRPEKEKDRIHHMEAVQAHVGPIFLTYPSHAGVKQIMSRITATPAIYDLTTDDGIHHEFWLIADTSDTAALCSIFDHDIPYTYIADGHHRAASAAKVGSKLQANNPHHTGQEEYNYFLSVLFADDELAIMDYNRVVKDLNGHTLPDFMNQVSQRFEVTETSYESCRPNRLHQLAMYIDHKWYSLTARPHTYTHDPIGILDVTILQDHLLAPVLGIADPRTDKRIDFVGGIRGLQELARRVDSGEMAVAFALYPVSLSQLMAIADAGNVMPPKSTWFEPKLRDGLIAHLF
jgi:uncharacterized protein (DUF1015 family)